MSNALAIAAVTTTLKGILSAALGGPFVMVKPPDMVGGSDDGLNLFLYHIVPSSAWRNQAMPGQVRSGESGHPPLGLNLYYVLSAHGAGGDDEAAQRNLGLAMAALHDHPVLTPSEIKAAVLGTPAESSELERQVERVRVTLQPLSIEEMYKLWSAFQTHYRVSAAYEVSIVLVESARPTRAPLPVLRAGPPQTNLGGPFSGPLVIADLPAFPALTAVGAPHDRQPAKQGDTITLSGDHLTGDVVEVELTHRLWSSPLTIATVTATSTEVTATLPVDVDAWPPGLYTVRVVVTTAGKTQRSNDLMLALAAEIGTLAVIPPSPPDPQSVSVIFTPKAWPGQRISLILGSAEVRLPEAILVNTGTVVFPVAGVAAGAYYARLRVDGVDSSLIDPVATPPQFDVTLKVTLS